MGKLYVNNIYPTTGSAVEVRADVIVTGATPKITIGDAGAEDTMLLFDGAAQDFHIALDDTADDLVIGVGSAAGTTTAIAINENAQVSVVDAFAANVGGTIGTLANDATPSVAAGNLWQTGGTTGISMFDDGIAGQTITVVSAHIVTYDVTGTNLKGGSADIVTAVGDITSWTFNGTNWYLQQFMDVSADLSVAAADLTALAGLTAAGVDTADLVMTYDSVTITDNDTNEPLLEIRNTHNGGTAGILKFNNTEAGADGADDDDLGSVTFWGNDDGTPTAQQYAGILAEIHDATSTEESGRLTLQVASHDGGVENGLILVGGSVDAEVDATVGLGSASVVTVPGHIDLAGDLDVDGTANLDAVDIDGAVAINPGSSSGVGLTLTHTDTDTIAYAIAASNLDADVMTITADALTTGNALNISSDSSNNNTRALLKITNDNTSATGTKMLHVLNDAVASSRNLVTIESTAAETGPMLEMKNTNAATDKPILLTFARASTTVADDMSLGQIAFEAMTDAAVARDYVTIDVIATDKTNFDQGGKLTFNVQAGGTAGTAASTNLFSIGGEDVANATQCEVVVNDAGINCDFRVEGDSEANLLHVDASADAIGIGNPVPGSTLEISKVSGQPSLELSAWSATATAAHAGVLKFQKAGTATVNTFTAGDHTTAGEILGRIEAYGVDDADGATLSSYIEFANDAISDPDSSPGKIVFATSDANDDGIPTVRLTIDDDGLATFVNSVAITTDLDVDGTANLDAVDIDGAVAIDPGAADASGVVITHAYTDTTAATIKALDINFDKTGASTSNNTIIGLDIDVDNTTATDGTNAVYGIRCTPTLQHAADAGNAYLWGMKLVSDGHTNGTTTNYGIQMRVVNSDPAGTVGIDLEAEDGGTDIKLKSSADTGDYFSISTTTHGATTIATVDDNAAAANLTFTIDGAIKLDGAGVEIENDSATGAPALLIDNDDTDQIALDIDAANITANVVDIAADALTTHTALEISTDARTTGTALNISDSNTSDSAGSLVKIAQTGSRAGSAASVGLNIDFDTVANANARAFKIDSEQTTGVVAELDGNAITTGNVLTVSADALTSGDAVSIYSNSSDTTVRALLKLTNDHASAVGVVGLEIVQDAAHPVPAIRCNGPILDTMNFNAVNDDSNHTITVAQLIDGFLARGTDDGLTAHRTDITPTAAQIVAAIPGCVANQKFKFKYCNFDSTHNAILDLGTTVTDPLGQASTTYTLTTGQSRNFWFYVTNISGGSEAVTIIPDGAAYTITS